MTHALQSSMRLSSIFTGEEPDRTSTFNYLQGNTLTSEKVEEIKKKLLVLISLGPDTETALNRADDNLLPENHGKILDAVGKALLNSGYTVVFYNNPGISKDLETSKSVLPFSLETVSSQLGLLADHFIEKKGYEYIIHITEGHGVMTVPSVHKKPRRKKQFDRNRFKNTGRSLVTLNPLTVGCTDELRMFYDMHGIAYDKASFNGSAKKFSKNSLSPIKYLDHSSIVAEDDFVLKESIIKCFDNTLVLKNKKLFETIEDYERELEISLLQAISPIIKHYNDDLLLRKSSK